MLARSLISSWCNCLIQLGCAEEPLLHGAYDRVVTAYQTGDRHYHTLGHIAQVLTALDRLTVGRSKTVSELYAAAWLHDVVYNPRATDNEWQSAQWAEVMLTELGANPTCIAVVSRLILLTQSHQVSEEDWVGQLLLDADLAILGSSPALYQRYSQQIRQEYAWVDDRTYRQARCQVLTTFLQRDRIYWHPDFQAHEEQIARQNIAAEIQRLNQATSFLSEQLQ